MEKDGKCKQYLRGFKNNNNKIYIHIVKERSGSNLGMTLI